MDSKFLERLADKAGFETGGGRRGDGVIGRLDHLAAFAALVAEECAKVCDENLRAYCERVGAPPPNMDHHSVYRSAADIRAKFGRANFGGLRIAVTVDPSMPPDQIEFRSDGKVVGRIVGIGTDDSTTEP